MLMNQIIKGLLQCRLIPRIKTGIQRMSGIQITAVNIKRRIQTGKNQIGFIQPFGKPFR
ncbi:hypothetical protein EVA_05434 [gut metagenome]|uniref:Uncharacterized protein n=1 Tax=gut metagenome TaxID=749906 RepID=J9GUH6_9ZZZZ